MAEYQVKITRTAHRELEDFEPQLGRRILNALEALGTQPRPTRCRKLIDSDSSYRIRVGRYRILYQVDNEAKIPYTRSVIAEEYIVERTLPRV